MEYKIIKCSKKIKKNNLNALKTYRNLPPYEDLFAKVTKGEKNVTQDPPQKLQDLKKCENSKQKIIKT